MQSDLERLKVQRERVRKESEARQRELEKRAGPVIHRIAFPGASLEGLDEKLRELEDRLTLISTIYVAFAVAPDIDYAEFFKAATSIAAGYERYRLVCEQAGRIEFGEIAVDLVASQH